MTSDRRNCILSNFWTDDDDHSLHDDNDHRPHDDDDLHRLHSGTMCFPGKIGTSMGIKENNIFGLISQTFQFMAKYIFSAIHLKNNPFCLKILGQSELSEDRGIRFKIWFQDHIFIHNCEFIKLLSMTWWEQMMRMFVQIALNDQSSKSKFWSAPLNILSTDFPSENQYFGKSKCIQ